MTVWQQKYRFSQNGWGWYSSSTDAGPVAKLPLISMGSEFWEHCFLLWTQWELVDVIRSAAPSPLFFWSRGEVLLVAKARELSSLLDEVKIHRARVPVWGVSGTILFSCPESRAAARADRGRGVVKVRSSLSSLFQIFLLQLPCG